MLGKLTVIILVWQTYSHLVNVIDEYNNVTTDRVDNPQDLRSNADTKIDITNAELKEISEKLFRSDKNNVAHYIRVNIQQTVQSNSTEDLAPQRLLFVDPKIWKVPTILALKALYNNYYQNTNEEEQQTKQELEEENLFINEIMKTEVMIQLMSFLTEKQFITSNDDQQSLMRQLWFDLYSRQRKISSSAFEHIFLSEIRGSKILGLHNWIYFHTQETSNDINYLGYLKNIDLNNKGSILKFRFNMNSLHKPVTSMFVGTSPELEIAYYTLCFLTRAQKKCKLSANNHTFSINTYILNYEESMPPQKKVIGTTLGSLKINYTYVNSFFSFFSFTVL